jgi:hypothetical protein
MVVELGSDRPQGTVVTIERVEGLQTPYVMSPADGVVREQRRVEVELTEFRGVFRRVSLRLTLKRRAGKLQLNTATYVDAGLKSPVSLTTEGRERLFRHLKTQAKGLVQQLATARTRRAQIEAAFASRRMLPVATRQAMNAELRLLRQQIPALENRYAVAQRDAAALERLNAIAEQIDGTAKVVYRIKAPAPDGPG